MNADQADESEFVFLGRYRPHEAAKLLRRLTEAGISFDTLQLGPGYEASGPTIMIEVRVDPACAADVDRIHRELFNDGLPNYNSSFFRGRRNV